MLEEGFTTKNADGKARRSYPMLIPWETVEKVSIEAEPRRFNYFSCKFVFHGKAPDYFKKTEFSGQQIVYDFAYVSCSDLEKAKDAISRRVIVEYTEID